MCTSADRSVCVCEQAFEDIHLHHRTMLKAVLDTAEQVFTCLFLLEMLLKWSGFGLKKYFTNPWCWLEFIIVNVRMIIGNIQC